MNEFLYLVQGRSDLIKNYFHLDNRISSDAIFITYDKQIDNAIYFPSSTWAESRNLLLEKALEGNEYQYYIFCDDDITFKKGGWEIFEKNLLSLKPKVAVPVFLEKTKATPLRWLKYHSILFNDEQMIAFHKDVLHDRILMPMHNKFDDLHWWACCRIQQILIQNFYAKDSIQLNDVHISNDINDRYSKQNEFMKTIHSWLADQFLGNYNDIQMSTKKSLHIILWRTINYYIRHRFSTKKFDHSVRENVLKNKLSPESDILKQYMSH